MSKPRIEDKLTVEQLTVIGSRIIDSFYHYPDGRRREGTEYGCDWPTMWMLYPTRCSVFLRLKRAYLRRVVDGELQRG